MLAEAVLHSSIPAVRPGTEAAALVRQNAMVGIRAACACSFLPTRWGCDGYGRRRKPSTGNRWCAGEAVLLTDRCKDLRDLTSHLVGPR